MKKKKWKELKYKMIKRKKGLSLENWKDERMGEKKEWKKWKEGKMKGKKNERSKGM